MDNKDSDLKDSYFNIYYDLENLTFIQLRDLLNKTFNPNDKKILNITKNNLYETKKELIESSEYTYFVLEDFDLLRCEDVDEINIFFQEKYNIFLKDEVTTKYLILNKYNHNNYIDWNFLNLLIILCNKKFQTEEINKFMINYNGEFIEEAILSKNLYINFNELKYFNKNFITDYLEKLFDLKSSNEKYFTQNYLNNLKNDYDLSTINKLEVNIKKNEVFNYPLFFNTLNTNSDYYFIESTQDLENYSLSFNNCINSKKYIDLLRKNKFLLVVDKKRKILFHLDLNKSKIIEAKGKNNSLVPIEIQEKAFKEIKKII